MNKIPEYETGGRCVIEKNDWKSAEDFLLFLKHKKAYLYAGDYCRGKTVLDFGCGTGYGTALLATYASKVTGVDIDEEALAYCRERYASPNLTFEKVSLSGSLPLEADSFDIIVSFQVIEHMDNVRAYLLEIKRMLRHGGILFITTPNRSYRLLPFQKPWNTYHKREFSAGSLKKEIRQIFKKFEILGISATEEVREIEYRRVEKEDPFIFYIFAPCVIILKKILPRSIRSFLKNNIKLPAIKKTQKPISADYSLNKYDIRDFSVVSSLKESLDFLAICSK